jgi:hypothetical protein
MMQPIKKFAWNDGGRSVGGFVGMTGDCVSRAISIATGIAYRDVYETLKTRYGSSPRNGVPSSIYGPYLHELGWIPNNTVAVITPNANLELIEHLRLAQGPIIIQCQRLGRPTAHLCTVIDHVLHDTWDARDEGAYYVTNAWTAGPQAVRCADSTAGNDKKQAGDLTQAEFEKIINRLRAIDNTARNQAATEAERENALRMMQALMLRHNLSRADLASDEGIESILYTRQACPVNGSRALSWEKDLANYLTQHIFPMTQWYSSRKGHRTLFFFYGPRMDVENLIQLFRELMITIATAAKLLFGGYARGSGASYAEGYVSSLPKNAGDSTETNQPPNATPNDTATSNPQNDESQLDNANRQLVLQRSIAVQRRAKDWLFLECGIRLVTTYRSARDFRDGAAEQLGKTHGAQHRVDVPNAPKRLN